MEQTIGIRDCGTQNIKRKDEGESPRFIFADHSCGASAGLSSNGSPSRPNMSPYLCLEYIAKNTARTIHQIMIAHSWDTRVAPVFGMMYITTMNPDMMTARTPMIFECLTL